jgi:hypothetical protein
LKEMFQARVRSGTATLSWPVVKCPIRSFERF